MKTWIIFVFLSMSLCEIEIKELKKHKSIKFNSEIGAVGMFYLNIEDFKENSKIYIVFNSENKEPPEEIEFEFNDTMPEKDYKLSETMKPTSMKYNDEVVPTTYTNEYDIKKTKNKKYLIVKFINNAGKLKIENLSAKWDQIIIIIFTIIFVCIFLIILIFIICKSLKNCKNENHTHTHNGISEEILENNKNIDYYDQKNKSPHSKNKDKDIQKQPLTSTPTPTDGK